MGVNLSLGEQTYLKNRLIDLLLDYSFEYSEIPKFKLAYKKELSDFYIDAKKTTLSSDGMILIGQLFYNLIKDLDVDGIGGLTLGADPIAFFTAFFSNLSGKKIEAFSVRKEPKKHGLEQWIEGNLKKNAKVVIVDDVITTGTSTISAIERARKASLVVSKVIVLVDRQEANGKANIEETGVEVQAIFTASDLKGLYRERRDDSFNSRRALSG